MNRTRSRIRPEIVQESGFVKDTEPRNERFMLRMVYLKIKSIKMQKDVYRCFLDNAESFDNADRHRKISNILATFI